VLRQLDRRPEDAGTAVSGSPGRPVDLSVCIVSFNTCDLLARAIRSAETDAAAVDHEVVVVDNASRDASAMMVRATFPSARLIVNAANRFFAAAQNQALAASRGRYLLVLNSDAEIRPGTIPPLIDYLARHPGVGAVTAPLFFPDGPRQRTCARFATYGDLLLEHSTLGLLLPQRRRHRDWVRRYADWDRCSEREVDVMPGSFILLRRTTLEAVGSFDERLRLYFNDDDWCMRARRAGLPLVFVPVAGAVHVERASARQVPGLARRLFFGDLVRYVATHFGWSRACWLWALTRPTYWGSAALNGVRPG
jgi:GT2 family glycosyltransferase